MNCTKGTIANTYERYSTIFNQNFNDMYNLSDIAAQIPNFTLPVRTNDTDYGSDQNKTFWKLQMPIATSGSCNGSVIFNAVLT